MTPQVPQREINILPLSVFIHGSAAIRYCHLLNWNIVKPSHFLFSCLEGGSGQQKCHAGGWRERWSPLRVSLIFWEHNCKALSHGWHAVRKQFLLSALQVARD